MLAQHNVHGLEHCIRCSDTGLSTTTSSGLLDEARTRPGNSRSRAALGSPEQHIGFDTDSWLYHHKSVRQIDDEIGPNRTASDTRCRVF